MLANNIRWLIIAMVRFIQSKISNISLNKKRYEAKTSTPLFVKPLVW